MVNTHETVASTGLDNSHDAGPVRHTGFDEPDSESALELFAAYGRGGPPASAFATAGPAADSLASRTPTWPPRLAPPGAGEKKPPPIASRVRIHSRPVRGSRRPLAAAAQAQASSAGAVWPTACWGYGTPQAVEIRLAFDFAISRSQAA